LRERLNELGRIRQPFLFVIDFDKKTPLVFDLDDEKIPLFKIDNVQNYTSKKAKKASKIKNKQPLTFREYAAKLEWLKDEIRAGNTYMINLTAKTKIELDCTLEEIFYAANAQFKLILHDKFVLFSPERFIKIENNKINTYPMKGTCNGDEESLKELIENPKEHAEHTMVVDLLRNDLSIVASDVKVDKFRAAIKIKAGSDELYQTISEVSGSLDENWQSKVGDILYDLLPAGSISGAPKKKTVELIKKIEGFERGYFTGVFGYFDGENLDSAVMIRFIEKTADGYVYKSGGGITIDSEAMSEYKEMLAKVYLPSV
jgi:para-aminobenzoate synthetase component 1